MISRGCQVFGNLKMHAVGSVLEQYAQLVTDQTFGLLVPYPYLQQALQRFNGTNVTIGAQSMSGHAKGAYTSQVSVEILLELGIDTVMIGHSEVRALGEDVAPALQLAQSHGMSVIYCVGEDRQSYEDGHRDRVLATQLEAITSVDNLVVAYEPVWSIGTGLVASTEDINAAVSMVKQWLGANIAGNSEKTSVLYGGSINNNNCLDVFSQTDVDGFLVGGVALKPQNMLEVIERCK